MYTSWGTAPTVRRGLSTTWSSHDEFLSFTRFGHHCDRSIRPRRWDRCTRKCHAQQSRPVGEMAPSFSGHYRTPDIGLKGAARPWVAGPSWNR